MNIFDPLISGSLSVSGSGEISGDLTVLGNLYATVSGTTSNAISASHAAEYLLTSSFEQFTGSYTTGSFTGSFIGDGSELYNIPASGVTGLNLNKIVSGSVSASISPNEGLTVNTNITVSGSILPNDTLSFDLGSDSKRWRDIYLAGNTINLGGTKISKDDNGNVKLKDSSNNLKNIIASEFQIGEGANAIIIKRDEGGYFRLAGETQPYIAAQLSGSFTGSGASLYDIPASGVTGLNLSQISEGSVTASISQSEGFRVNTNAEFTGSVSITGSIILNGEPVGTGKLNDTEFYTYTSSLDPRISSLETSTSSLNSFTSSINTTIKSKLNTEGVISGSEQVTISDTTGYSTFSSSVDTSISNLSSSVASYNLLQDGRLDNLETSTGSLNSFTSSIDTTIKSKLNSDDVISGSIQVNITGTTGYSSFSSSINTSIDNSSTTLSSSVAGYNLLQDGRLDSLEEKTGSYSTTGSNSFLGDQTITGSLIVTNNFTVLGSSSLLFVTTSQLAVSASVISVNIFEPAERFGGLKVYDSGSESHQATASLLWDSLHNHWIYQNVSGANYSGGMLLSGPRNTGSLGDEPGLTSGKIAKSIGGDHLDNSIITETNGGIGISGSLVITGSIASTVSSLVSQSVQIDHNQTTNFVPNEHIDHTSVSITAGDGLSGGGTIASTRTLTVDTGSTHFIGGARKSISVSDTTGANGIDLTYSDSTGVLSGVLQNSAITIAGTSTSLGGSISASTIGNAIGAFSGSSQVSFNGITDKPTLVSGSSQISFNSISDKPTLVSGSSQITYGSISGIPSGIVSGSSQVSYTGLSNIPSGIVSGSSQLSSTFVAKAGDTMTGQLIVGATGTGNSATLKINNSSASSFNHSIEAFSANMTAGQTNILVVGASGSTKNSGYIGYNWAGAASNSNYVSIGHWGADHLFRVYADGTVYMGTVTTGTWQGSSISTTYTAAKVTAVNAGTGISVDTTTGSVTVTNSGVTSLTGTANQVQVSASTGGVTLSLPQSIATTNSPTFSSLTLSGNLSLTSGYISGYVGSTGSGDSYAPFRFSQDYSGWMMNVAGTPGSNNGWGLFWAGNSGAQYGTNGTGGPGDIWTNSTNPNEYVFVGNGSTNMAVHGNTGNVWIAGTLRTAGAITFPSGDRALETAGSGGVSIYSNEINAGAQGGTGDLYLAWRRTNSVNVGQKLVMGTASGVQQYIRMGIFSNSQTNTGEAWIGRASDRNSGTMTVQLGGNSASSRQFEVVDYAWSVVLFNVTSAGNATLSGVFTENSSIRYKENVETIKYGLDKVLQMRGVTYTRKDNGNVEAGVIAEEMNEVTPLVVLKNEEGQVDSVSYGRINAYLIEAVKELNQKIEEQNLIISDLKRKLGL